MACTPEYRERVWALAAGKLGDPEAGDLLEHIARCAACGEDLDLFADLSRTCAALEARKAASRGDDGPSLAPGAVHPALGPAALRPSGEPVTLRPARGWPALRTWRAAAAAAVVLITALAGGWVVLRRDGPRNLARLADIEPIAFVEGALRGPSEDRLPRFREAMRAYARGEYAAASGALAQLVEEDPGDHKLRVYLGIGLLQVGKAGEAIHALEPAVEGGEGLVRERALWYLGAAHLLREDAPAARRTLEALRDLHGDYQPNAEDLLDKLRRLGGLESQ